MKKRGAVVCLSALLVLGLGSERARADEVEGFAPATPSADTAPQHATDATDATASTPGEDSGEEVLAGWEFQLVPYVWTAATSGSVAIGERSRGFDVSLGEVYDLLGSLEAGGAMVHLEARKGPFGGLVDWVFTGIDTTQPTGRRQIDTRVKALTYLLEFAGTYRFLDYPTTLPSRLPIAADVLFGGRWNRLSTELGRENLPQDAKSVLSFVDPMVGVRFVVPFYESSSVGALGITFRGDVGGFEIVSDLSWNLVGSLLWRTPWTVFAANLDVYAGYKAYYVDVEESVDGTDVSIALQMNGPALGVGFRF